MAKLSAFEKAFAAARAKKQNNFSFGGKSYNTKLASGGSSLPKTTTAIPKSRDSAVTSKSSESSYSGLSDVGKVRRRAALDPSHDRSDAATVTKKFSDSPSTRGKGGNASFLPMMKDMSTMNAFKQSESRRSADESTKNIVGSSLKSAANSVLKKRYQF